jgi:hypothetical protein
VPRTIPLAILLVEISREEIDQAEVSISEFYVGPLASFLGLGSFTSSLYSNEKLQG